MDYYGKKYNRIAIQKITVASVVFLPGALKMNVPVRDCQFVYPNIVKHINITFFCKIQCAQTNRKITQVGCNRFWARFIRDEIAQCILYHKIYSSLLLPVRIEYWILGDWCSFCKYDLLVPIPTQPLINTTSSCSYTQCSYDFWSIHAHGV